MIILDTNVFSEIFKPSPSDAVVRWLDAQDRLNIFLTAVTLAEVLYGLELLPSGKRRIRLSAAIHEVFSQDFHDRILPFDEEAARAFATIAAQRSASGRPISQMDAMIAAIASSRRATLATRNTADFEHSGVSTVNPWTG